MHFLFDASVKTISRHSRSGRNLRRLTHAQRQLQRTRPRQIRARAFTRRRALSRLFGARHIRHFMHTFHVH